MTIAALIQRASYVRWRDEDLPRLAKMYSVKERDIVRALATAKSSRSAPPPQPVPVTALGKADAPAARWTWTVSSPSIDRMGDSISQDGIRLDSYRANPVVLWSHDSSSLPIGKATSISVVGGNLVATMVFNGTRMAQAVEQAVRSGSVRMCSIGFIPLAWEPLKQGGIRFDVSEMLEFSITPIGANRDALLMNQPADGRSAKARRERDLDLARLRLAPPASETPAPKTTKHERIAELARLRARR
jgi:HK97 family phage prohead protease